MIKRPRTRPYAPMNSGSKTKPERINLRCTTEQCGRFLTAVDVARIVRQARNPALKTNISDAVHHVIIPVFEKVARTPARPRCRNGTPARVYLEEFVRKEDYIRNRVHKYQMKFKFGI